MDNQAAHPARDENVSDLPTVALVHEAPESFAILLQDGFEVLVPHPCTLREFLCELVGVCGDYAQKSIQTIFLDGKAIDDMDQAVLVPSSRLALSAALPGLVGATMRRGGYYSRLREGITHHAEADASFDENKPFRLQTRLFNAVGRDLAEIFLKYGVIVPSETLRRFLASRPSSFFQNLHGASLNGSSLPVGQSAQEAWPLPEGDVLLTVPQDS